MSRRVCPFCHKWYAEAFPICVHCGSPYDRQAEIAYHRRTYRFLACVPFVVGGALGLFLGDSLEWMGIGFGLGLIAALLAYWFLVWWNERSKNGG
jgi:hypothetical protein